MRLDLPHRLSEDDVYRGMFIPKGSLVSSSAFSLRIIHSICT